MPAVVRNSAIHPPKAVRPALHFPFDPALAVASRAVGLLGQERQRWPEEAQAEIERHSVPLPLDALSAAVMARLAGRRHTGVVWQGCLTDLDSVRYPPAPNAGAGLPSPLGHTRGVWQPPAVAHCHSRRLSHPRTLARRRAFVAGGGEPAGSAGVSLGAVGSAHYLSLAGMAGWPGRRHGSGLPCRRCFGAVQRPGRTSRRVFSHRHRGSWVGRESPRGDQVECPSTRDGLIPDQLVLVVAVVDIG